MLHWIARVPTGFAAGLALLALALLASGTALAQDSLDNQPDPPVQPDQPDQPIDPDLPEDQPEDQPEPPEVDDETAVRQAAQAFISAIIAHDGDAAWDLLAADSQEHFDRALDEVQEAVAGIPAAERHIEIDELGATPTEILALESGKSLFVLLMDRITVDLNDIRKLRLDAVDLGEDEEPTEAALTWIIPGDESEVARDIIREAPQSAVKDEDGWRIVITVE